MPPAGFEHTISVGERPQTYALDREATGTGVISYLQATKSTYINQKQRRFAVWVSISENK